MFALPDTRMRDGALHGDHDRREGIVESDPYPAPDPKPSVDTHAEIAAKVMIVKRLLNMYPWAYTQNQLSNKSLAELTALLKTVPHRPEGPPPPQVSFLTYE